MNKPSKLFLTSGFCMVMIAPAMADIASDNSNPTCDATTIGATSGDTALDAVWNLVNQTCESGKYFDMTSATCVTCTSNNYCPGGTYSVESQDNGLNSCPSGYGLSASGASAQTDCYRTCTTNDVAHSTAVSGGYYYGNNNQCSAESCALGWQKTNTINLSEYTFSNPTSSAAGYINAYGDYGTGYSQTIRSKEYYGLTEPNTWAIDKGEIIYGKSICSGKTGEDTYHWDNNANASDYTATLSELHAAGLEGGNCWCQISGIKENGVYSDIYSPYWIYVNVGYWGGACFNNCASMCADHISGSTRTTVFSSIPYSNNSACTLTEQSCIAGEYFDETAIMCKTCDANHYCPGGVYTVESESYGKNNCPSGYGLSATGNPSQNGCYRNCTTSDVAHSTGVSGGYYYGDNNQCGATSCAAGWHLNEGINLANEFSNAQQTNSGTNTRAYVDTYGNYNGSASHNLTDNNTWFVSLNDYGNFGTVYGQVRCSTISGQNFTGHRTTTSSINDESNLPQAKHCYCRITGYEPIDGKKRKVSSLWVYEGQRNNDDENNTCAKQCANDCSNQLFYGYGDLRNVLFSSATSLSSCEANTINIDWYNMDTIHEQNQCTYSESITLPETNPERTGYNFTGWSVRPASTPVQAE